MADDNLDEIDDPENAGVEEGEAASEVAPEEAPKNLDPDLENWEGLNPNIDDSFNRSSGRALSQDEIDSLLGFSDSSGPKQGLTGIEAIIESGMVSYERLPMLEIVFDRLVRILSTSLRNFTSDNVEIAIDTISSVRFGDYLNSIPLPAMMTVFKVEEWDNYGLITIDSSLIYAVVDVLLGGRRGTATMRIEGRPYTTIERELIAKMINVVLSDLAVAFEPLSSVTMRFERLETNPRFATIARPANAAIVTKLRIDMEDRGGRLDLLLPYASLEPVREVLLQMFMGEKFGRDSIWENHLATELWFTDVKLKAVLDEIDTPLEEVMNWKKGSFFPLKITPDSDIKLVCGDVPLFKGKMGNQNNNMAIRIDRAIR